MLSLISNLRLNRVKVQKPYGFKSEITNYSTAELNNEDDENSNCFSAEIWLQIYR